jgi:hypothetical protein
VKEKFLQEEEPRTPEPSVLQPPVQQREQPVAPQAQPQITQDSLSVQWNRSKFRASRIHHLTQPPEYFIKVFVPTSIENQKKSRNQDDFIRYRLETQLYFINYSALELRQLKNVLIEGQIFAIERTHDEIKKFYSELIAKYPEIVIPPPPTKFQMENGCSFINDSKTEFRVRNYQIWFEYLCNMQVLQESSLLIHFLTGINSWHKPQPKGTVASNQVGHGVTTHISYIQSSVIEEGLYHAFQYRDNDQDYGSHPHKDVVCRVGDLFPKSSCELCDEYIYIFKSKSFQDLMTMKRDIENLSLNSPYLISACRNSMTYLTNMLTARRDLVSYIDQRVETDQADGNNEEFRALLDVGKTIKATNTHLEHQIDSICYLLLEPFQLFYGSILPNTLKTVEKQLKNFQSYILSSSLSASSPKPSNITKEQEKEYLTLAGILARSWDATFKIKSAILLNRIIYFVKQTIRHVSYCDCFILAANHILILLY